ncbi:MAG: fibronectin type III domain-containing protein, partial [Gammaproteobacteria bacterium]|nr:fibronectin type III domain-containing protein [Gammaproteobacteria bacterium]
MQSSTYNRIQQGLRFARNYTFTLLGAALFWNSLAALATDQLLTLRLPKVESIKVGEGVSWLLRSTPRNGKQPAVFLVSGPAGVSFRRVSEDQHQLNWSPSPDDLGRHRFTFLLEDVADRSISVTQTLQVDVLPVAKESVVTLGPVQDQSVRPGEHLRFRVAAENSLGGGTLLHIDKLPEGARFDQSDDGSRTFTWQPGEHQSGHYVFRIIATDANDSALFDEATIKVTVEQLLAASALHGKATPDPEQGVDIGSVGNTVDLVTATSIESLPERVIVAGQAMSQLVRAEYSAD